MKTKRKNIKRKNSKKQSKIGGMTPESPLRVTEGKQRNSTLKTTETLGSFLAPTEFLLSYIDWLISAFQQLVTNNIEGNGVNKDCSIYNTITNYVSKELGREVFVLALDTDSEDLSWQDQFDEFRLTENYMTATTKEKNHVSIIYYQTGERVLLEGESTHFQTHLQEWDKGVEGNTTFIDPYDGWQPHGTQGFCQMFAFFGAMGLGDTLFTKVSEEMEKEAPIEIYAQNNMTCLHESIQIILKVYERKKRILSSQWEKTKATISSEKPYSREIIDFNVEELFQRLINIQLDYWKLYMNRQLTDPESIPDAIMLGNGEFLIEIEGKSKKKRVRLMLPPV